MQLKQSSMMHLLLYSSVALTASAAVIRAPLVRRIEDCQIDTSDNMADDPNRLNTDGTAGIGAEFESPQFLLRSTNCNDDDTNAAKRKVVAGRTGTNWQLTADSIGKAGKLQAEYIIDGTKVKVGSQDDATNGAKVAASLAQDLIDWKPWASPDTRNVDIADNNCNPWEVNVRATTDPAKVSYQPQITAPMPLEALYSLMKENVANPMDKNILDGTKYRDGPGLVLVTQDFFQSNPSGIDKTKVTDDVLAFCTLVLSYGKGALETLRPGSSPKLFTTFMPRTNFNKIFAQVSSKLPAKGDDLWALFNNLACYTGDGSEVDTAFCTGDPSSPTPIDTKFGDLTFTQPGDAKCNIKDWIHGLDQDSQDDDDLTKFDRSIDGSIGNLGLTQEKLFNSDRSVPIFEFRDLDTKLTNELEQFMRDVDQAIQDLHSEFASPPARKVRRQDSVCTPDDSDPAPAPTEADPPVCAGVGTIKWMGRDALNGVIPQFCDTAEQQGVQDPDSGSLQRTYLDGTVDKVSLSIDWPSGGDFRPNKDDCVRYLSTIMDGCDGNDPEHNPLNWKHGGSLQAGIAKFNVNPLNDRYTSGTCSFHVHETEYVDGFNTPGFAATYYFYLGVDIKDGNGNTIGGTNGDDVQAGQDAANPYVYNGLYAPLSMLPESQGGDYIQFDIGDQHWQSSQTDQSQFPRCSLGDWDTSKSTFEFTGGPRGRDMDCSFSC